MSEQKQKTQREIIEDHMPRVVEWLQEIKVSLDDVTGVGISLNPTRDYEREIEEESHWQLWKPSKTITVTIRTAKTELKRTWHNDVWNAELRDKDIRSTV